MGAAQVGILQALSAAGVRPAAVVGTSVGAFNAAFLAFHPEDHGHHALRAVWESLRLDRIFHRNPLRLAYAAARRRNHLYSADLLRTHLLRHIPAERIEAAPLPLHVVTTNLGTGAKTVFSAGPVVDAVLASAAVPGLFPPVRIDGRLYADGALTANLDLETAAALGRRQIVAVDVSASDVPMHARTIPAVIWRALEIALHGRTATAFAGVAPSIRITLLRPGPAAMRRLGAIAATPDLIDAAYHLGEELITRALDSHGRLAHGLVSTDG